MKVSSQSTLPAKSIEESDELPLRLPVIDAF